MSKKKRQSKAKSVRHLRFSDADWAEVDRQAGKRGITAAEYVRDIVRLHLLRDETMEHLVTRMAQAENRLAIVEHKILDKQFMQSMGIPKATIEGAANVSATEQRMSDQSKKP